MLRDICLSHWKWITLCSWPGSIWFQQSWTLKLEWSLFSPPHNSEKFGWKVDHIQTPFQSIRGSPLSRQVHRSCKCHPGSKHTFEGHPESVEDINPRIRVHHIAQVPDGRSNIRCTLLPRIAANTVWRSISISNDTKSRHGARGMLNDQTIK